MSGQPLQKPLDAAKFRRQYLAGLALEVSINDKNFLANQVYKKTGVPQQPTDQRTTSQKFRDFEIGKVELRSQLLEITNAEEADIIAQKLDRTRLEYALNMMPALIKEIKPKYKLGVPAYIFLATLDRFIKDQETLTGIQLGLPQLTNGDNVMYEEGDFIGRPVKVEGGQSVMQGGYAKAEDYEALIEIVQDLPESDNQRYLLKGLRDFIKAVPSDERINYILNGKYTINPQIKLSIKQQFGRAVSDLPTREQIDRLVDVDPRMLEGDGIRIYMNEVADLVGTLPQVLEDYGILLNMMEEASSEYEQEIGIIFGADWRTRGVVSTGGLGADPNNPINDAPDIVNATGDFMYIPPERIEAGARASPYTNKILRTYIDYLGNNIEDFYYPSSPTSVKMTRTSIRQHLEEKDELIKAFFGIGLIMGSAEAVVTSTLAVPIVAATINPLAGEEAIDLGTGGGGDRSATGQSTAGLGGMGFGRKKRTISGRGLGRPRTRTPADAIKLVRSDAIKPSDIDNSVVIKPARYAQLGNLIINRNRLADGVISVKTKGGGFVKELLAQRVSHNLANVIRKITGGSILNFKELEGLNESERTFLHKLSKRASILDRIDIPSPKIDTEERDIRQFEICKGEILAGNNSNELIKKFKLLILKLVNNGVLPRSQGKELLFDLTSIGF